MNDIVARPAEEMSREELYELVWQTSMSKLGAQLATNGPGLSALCRKRQIPTPPLGYWQKKAVGRAPEMHPLPSFEPPPKPPLQSSQRGAVVDRQYLRPSHLARQSPLRNYHPSMKTTKALTICERCTRR